MHLTFRTKLTAIVGIAALALALVIVASDAAARRVESQVLAVQKRYLPKVELGPELDRDFERLTRSFQDAVAAHDLDTLAKSGEIEETLLRRLDGARDAVTPADAAGLRAAVEEYYAAAHGVATRLIGDETGEALLEAMAVMQRAQQRARERLTQATSVDRAELTFAFESIAQAERAAGSFRLWISLWSASAWGSSIGRSKWRATTSSPSSRARPIRWPEVWIV
jgi:hypothetical protein